MDIEVGTSYRFVFDGPFAALGYDEGETPLNGFYKVVNKTLYEQLVEDGVDFVEMLYEHVGKTITDYTADISSYAGVIFYKLQDLTDTDTYILMPATSITQVPIVGIGQYGKVVLATDIGVIADTTTLDSVKTLIEEMLVYIHGLTPSTTYLTYDQTWMTDTDYADLQEERDAIKGDSCPTELDGTTFPFNRYAEIQRLLAEKSALEAQIVALNEIIVAASAE